jgi:hypothetical protein
VSKLTIALGILACSVLFFLSGALTGYSIRDAAQEKSKSEPKKKPKRIQTSSNPIIGQISQRVRDIAGTEKLRRPSNPAIEQAARSYSNAPSPEAD